MRRSSPSVAIAAALVAGCVPLLPHAYFRPSAAEGLVPQDRCWKTHRDLVVTRGAGDVTIRIVEADGDRRYVAVVVGLPAGHSARIDPAGAEWIDDAGGRHPLAFDGVHRDERIDVGRLPFDTVLTGETFATSPTVVARHWWSYAPIAPGDARTFTVVPPSVAVDGASQRLPVVRFDRTVDVQPLAPLQC